MIIEWGEVFVSNLINKAFAPLLLVCQNKSVFEQSHSFMSPQSYQIFQCVDGLYCFINGIFPSCEFSGWINVMGLIVRCEMFLRFSIKFNHCICQILRVLTKIYTSFQHSLVKSTKNLFQWIETWEINQNQRTMTQKSWIKWFTTNISGWIACSYKLNSLQRNPLSVSGSPKSMLFC